MIQKNDLVKNFSIPTRYLVAFWVEIILGSISIAILGEIIIRRLIS
jgi:hypothetical protein